MLPPLGGRLKPCCQAYSSTNLDPSAMARDQIRSVHNPSRRDFLTVGAVAGLGLNLTDLLSIRHAKAEKKHCGLDEPTAHSAIHIFLPGGIAAQESFDPKPYAPIEYRGEFKSIPTNVDGIQLSETLPKTAQVADRLTLIRSVTHGQGAHERGTQNMFTGYLPNPSSIESPDAREAFNIDAEEAKLRYEYGRNAAGQRMLTARRLVEAGVRFVTLTYGNWDHHRRIAQGVRGQMPAFDQAFARLIRDLDERGLLRTTLVMVTTEFGRTPKINRNAGRDHWPGVFSVVLAGGGIRGGMAYGATNATATEPDQDPIGPEDLMATIHRCLGFVADRQPLAPGDRPSEIAKDGKVRQALLA
jgi:uncharacterized protein (DUF1501 family)